MRDKVPVAIVGASGYSGEELVRLLLGHPYAELTALTSRQFAGQTVAQVFPRFAAAPAARALRFDQPDPDRLARAAETVFLALPHGVAAEFAVPLLAAGARVIDLSADFRVHDPAVYKEFYHSDHPAPALLARAVYGLPEFYRAELETASLIASPGCYPTSVLIPLLPLLKERLVQPVGMIADSLSAVSGAGRKIEAEYLFVECNDSLRPYGLPKHRHLSEMEQELSRAAGVSVVLQFTPHLVPVSRGILTTLYLTPAEPAGDVEGRVRDCYRRAFEGAAFVRLLEGKALPDTQHIAGTNSVEIAWRFDPRTQRLIVISALDNLLKGASGQAVQSFNLRSGFPEAAGLL